MEDLFVPAGLVTFGSVGSETPVRPRPRSRLWLRIPLLGGKAATAIAGPLSPLYRRAVAGTLIALSLAAHAAVLLKGPGLGLGAEWLRPQDWILAGLLYCGSTLWHELGHATALGAFGLSPGSVGFGMYRFFPVFYSDVSRSWHLPRGKRIVVDLGGIYFQLAFAGALAAWCVARPDPVVSRALFLVDMGLLLNLNPFLRMDGYWLAQDLTGVRDLRGSSRSVIRSLFGRKDPGGEAPSRGVRIYGVASALYFAGLLAWAALGLAPHLIREVVDAALRAARPLSGDGTASWTALGQLALGGLVLAGLGFLFARGLIHVPGLFGRRRERTP